MNRRKAIQQTAYLLGGAVSASVMAGVMSGCQAEKQINWQPQFLNKDEAILVGELAETILPETDTLGAKSLGVPEYIDIVVKDCFTLKDQQAFRDGLAKMNAAANSLLGQSFVDSSPEERQTFLEGTEKAAFAERQKTGKKAFIITLKELVLTGYFTTEYAITELMDYRPVPGIYEGCVEEPQKIQVGIEGRSA
ncbi:MAG: gluconate 2-dehydrogenase subunit 3 family protein [Bacteroidota bacterium]